MGKTGCARRTRRDLQALCLRSKLPFQRVPFQTCTNSIDHSERAWPQGVPARRSLPELTSIWELPFSAVAGLVSQKAPENRWLLQCWVLPGSYNQPWQGFPSAGEGLQPAGRTVPPAAAVSLAWAPLCTHLAAALLLLLFLGFSISLKKKKIIKSIAIRSIC